MLFPNKATGIRTHGILIHRHQGNHLPSADVKVLLAEERDHNCAVCELPAGQRSQCLLCRRGLFVLDVNLANTSTLSATSGSWHLGVEDLAILGTLLLDVVENFCFMISRRFGTISNSVDLPSDSSVSMSSSGVIMFIKHRTLPDSASDFA